MNYGGMEVTPADVRAALARAEVFAGDREGTRGEIARAALYLEALLFEVQLFGLKHFPDCPENCDCNSDRISLEIDQAIRG